jgi:hypothetical protein
VRRLIEAIVRLFKRRPDEPTGNPKEEFDEFFGS